MKDRPRFTARVSGTVLGILLVCSTGELAAADNQALVVAAKQAMQARVFNVRDFGAVGNGTAMDTTTVQKAIDACHAAGGGTVRVPAGNFQIGTIRLKSHVTLSLDYRASLLGSQDMADYPTEGLDDPREGGPRCLIYAKDASNITLEGLGVIDGRGTPKVFPRRRGSPRPRLLRMVHCENVTFSGLKYRRPAFWGLHLIDCRDVHFNGITIDFRDNHYNNDGLDLDGCENVLIDNCDINSGDDAICLKSTRNPCRNIVVRNCRVSSNTAAFKCGTSSRGGFMDVTVRNCHFYDCPMGAIKLELVDGGRMENIDISRIVMEDVGNPIFIRLGNRGQSYERRTGQKYDADVEPEGMRVGTLKKIRISDLVAEVTVEDKARAMRRKHMRADLARRPEAKWAELMKAKSGPIMISGIPGHYVEDVVLENIKISYPGGGNVEDAQRVVREDIARYPEQFFFGILPAWGAYIRHARNIEFKNVELTLRSPDARQRIVLDDVESFVAD